LRVSVVWAALLSGCASAGGTAGIFDIGSVWYKHPTTGDVQECGGGLYPGVQIRRYNCGKTLQGQGYVEVEKCAKAPANASCVTDAEIRRAEEVERGQPSTGRAWVLWLPVLDSEGQPLPDQWSPLRLFDYRQDCEAEQRRLSTQSVICLPDTVDPRGRRGSERQEGSKVTVTAAPL
jgi:hypothetical protein